MKLKIGILGTALFGFANGCRPAINELSCEFVDTCIAESAHTSSITNSSITNESIVPATNNAIEARSPIGYSARWGTDRKCDVNGKACHWEYEQFPQYGDAFKNNGGQIVINTPGYYRINVALFERKEGSWMSAHLKKNGQTLAIR